MKIDLHCHTKERSLCSIVAEEALITCAIDKGLDGIAITDHNANVPKEHLKELNQKYAPFKVFSGIEIRTIDYGDDVLILGIHDDLLEKKSWTYEELYYYRKANNAYMVFAHPYRYSNEIKVDLEKYPPDALEFHSTNIGSCDLEIITGLAHKINARLIVNSDAHQGKHVGIFHNEFMYDIHSDEDLVMQLRMGNYKCSSFPEQITVFNQEVKKRERIIHQMLKEGKSASDYETITGNWSGYFERVAMGRSYEI